MITKAISGAQASKVSPRDRILAAARDLFYRHGIRAVGVDAIAEAAGTNKMTLYRHFESKDALVAEYLRGLGADTDAAWDVLADKHRGDPHAQLVAWLKAMASHIVDPTTRGCALSNAAVELPEKHHPARAVVEQNKRAARERLAGLCREAGLLEPELLADELFVLVEGARVCAQSLGREGPTGRLVHMGEAIIAAHTSQAAE